jgi:hypothetical protein
VFYCIIKISFPLPLIQYKMQTKKIMSTVVAMLLIMQGPLQIAAASDSGPSAATMESGIMQSVMQWANNPEQVLSMVIEEAQSMQLTSREQYHVDQLVTQFTAIIDKAPTNEARIQKSINTSVYLMDLMVLHGKKVLEARIAIEQDPAHADAIRKEMSKDPFLPKVRVIAGVIMAIVERYLGPDVMEYVAFMDNLSDNPTQEEVTLVTHKMTALLTMIDNAFADYAPTINAYLMNYAGITTTDLFRHLKVISLLWIDMYVQAAWTDTLSQDEINEISWFHTALSTADAKTQAAYTVYTNIASAHGTIQTYWESIKTWLKPDFVAWVDTVISSAQDRMGNVQKRARDTKVMADLSQLSAGLAVYNADIGHYPQGNLTSALVPEILTSLPTSTLDGSDYKYTPINNYHNIILMAKVETLDRANWIDIQNIFDNKKAIPASVIKQLCPAITIWDAISLSACTITDTPEGWETLRLVMTQ